LAAFDAVLLVRGDPISGRGCTGNVSTGLAVLAGVWALISFILGDLAYDIAIASGVPAATLETHESLGTWTAFFIIFWALVRSFFWWRGSAIEGGLKAGVTIIEIAGSILIIVASYFGGQLVYELGVNVTRAAGG
jgi:uncharacterized membrane protein